MSKTSRNNQLPENVVFYPEAAGDYRKLDRSRKVQVLKALRKIASAPLQVGKPLGTKAGLALSGLRSAYVDNRSIRIVWLVTESGEVQIVIVAGIAERDGKYVYNLVSSRKNAISEFARTLKKRDP